MAYAQTYDKLHLACITPEQHERTCNYWYLVTNGATSHTAFTTAEALLLWLHERNLSIPRAVPETRGTWDAMFIMGQYFTQSHMNEDEFYALPATHETKTLCNGRYTLARITEDDGIVTVHTLNPNVKTRPEYDYAECSKRYK